MTDLGYSDRVRLAHAAVKAAEIDLARTRANARQRIGAARAVVIETRRRLAEVQEGTAETSEVAG